MAIQLYISSTIFSLLSINVHGALTWSTSQTKLPRGDVMMAGAYSPQTDLLWLLGGYLNKKQLLSVDSTDVIGPSSAIFSTDSTDALPHEIVAESQPYTRIGHILYIINPSGTGFSIFDSISETFTANYNNIVIPNAVSDRACLAHIDDYLIITGGYDAPSYMPRSMVQIYDLNAESWILSANDMIESRYHHACTVNPNTKYLYVIGGYSPTFLTDTISKLYVGDIDNIDRYGWIDLTDKLGLELYKTDAAIYGDDIYVIGGAYHDGEWRASSDVYHILPDDTVVLDSNLPDGDNNPCVILADNILFVLGGYGPSFNYKDSIYYAELPSLNPTASPSKDPTIKPTKHPTLAPTMHPTKAPTKHPTMIPTKDPTVAPTKNPTEDPTKAPSNDPTASPTEKPTFEFKENEVEQWSTEYVFTTAAKSNKFNQNTSHFSMIVLYIVIAAAVLLCICVVFCLFYKKGNKKKKEEMVIVIKGDMNTQQNIVDVSEMAPMQNTNPPGVFAMGFARKSDVVGEDGEDSNDETDESEQLYETGPQTNDIEKETPIVEDMSQETTTGGRITEHAKKDGNVDNDDELDAIYNKEHRRMTKHGQK